MPQIWQLRTGKQPRMQESTRLRETGWRTTIEILRFHPLVMTTSGNAHRYGGLTVTTVSCTEPSENIVANISFVPILSMNSHICSVRTKLVDTGRHSDSVERTSRAAQSEKKSGSSIIHPHNRNNPSIVVVNRTGPESVVPDVGLQLMDRSGKAWKAFDKNLSDCAFSNRTRLLP